jgi:hypothetical protein
MKTPEQIEFDYLIAVHEVAHFTICSHYGIHSRFKILKPEEQYFETSKNNFVVAGTCTRAAHQEKEMTDFQQAVLGWAGAVMELIAGVKNPTLEINLPFNAKNLKDCYHQAECSFEKLSNSDQCSIALYKKSYWTTFKRAYHLLRRKKASIMARAAEMSRAGEKQTLLENTPVPAISEAKAIAFRADLLKKHLAEISTENPDRPRWEKILAYLECGQWPTPELAGANDAAQKI